MWKLQCNKQDLAISLVVPLWLILVPPTLAQDSTASIFAALRQFGIEVPPNLLQVASLRSLNPPAPCFFRCPSGEDPVHRAGHVARSNGCGSYGFERLLIPEVQPFEECCNRHDICYDTCGAVKSECDRLFQNCLVGTCNYNPSASSRSSHGVPLTQDITMSNCISTAELIGSGPVIAGCSAFMKSQSKACTCSKSELYHPSSY